MTDTRDPEKLGSAYLAARQAGASISEAVNAKVDGYVATGYDHAAARKAELEARVAQGDRFALDVLNGKGPLVEPADED